MWLNIVLICAAIVVVYYWLKSHFRYWEKRGVPTPHVCVLFGNIYKSVFCMKALGQLYNDVYNDYPNLSYVGFYKLRQPALILRDPGLMKDVLIKDFNSFHDNDFQLDEKADPLFAKNPFARRGHAWKVTRNQVTPSFTSKRIKAMFPLMEVVCKRLLTYLEETPMGKDGIQAEDLAEKFTIDNVATCAFGMEANSFKDPDAKFQRMGRKILNPTLINALKFLLFFVCPSVCNYLDVKLITDDVSEYFTTIIEKSLEYRKKNNVQRDDFLDAMTELKNKLGEDVFNNEDITAHALGFFLDGFATSSIVISYALYELGANLDVQSKLKEEIDATLLKNGGKFTYDSIISMPYLDKVIYENLRKNPAVLFLAKVCTQPYTLPPPSGAGPDVLIDPGTVAVIPVYGIHRDPKYYPNAERFDPERFSEDNKETRPKLTYFALGDGPRVCLGQRFGVGQTKIVIAHIIANFEIRVNNKTALPLEIEPRSFLNKAIGGLWLNFYKRR